MVLASNSANESAYLHRKVVWEHQLVATLKQRRRCAINAQLSWEANFHSAASVSRPIDYCIYWGVNRILICQTATAFEYSRGNVIRKFVGFFYKDEE